jgi:ribonucleoside-diphosphate reductase beta chain
VRNFQTTSVRGLNQDLLPLRLYHKAKKFGVWDPRDIDFTQDKKDWRALRPKDQENFLRVLSMFQAGEEAVTVDLLPLISAIAQEGRLEEELYLTTFLFEEAKHTEFFRRFLDEVVGERGDLARFHTPSYRKIFYEELPNAMNRLHRDTSPAAIAEASVTYNMIVEGVLAETGYYIFFETMSKNGKLPGLIKGISYLKTDESRHIGYGTYLLQRLICEHEEVWPVVYNRLSGFIPTLVDFMKENFDPANLPEGLDYNEFLNYSSKQLSVRIEILSRAKGKSLQEIYKTSDQEVGVL